MLDHADAVVAARDTGLPGLRTLLDPGAFCAVLQRLCPDREIRSVSARYVRYKPHTSCLVAFDVAVGDASVGVYARCHAEDQVVKIANARLRMEVRGGLGAGLLADPEEGIAVFAYPNDYEVKSLRKLFEGERTPLRMKRMLPAHPHLHGSPPTVLRYKPERSANSKAKVARRRCFGSIPTRSLPTSGRNCGRLRTTVICMCRGSLVTQPGTAPWRTSGLRGGP
jgi:hypothetical protein